MNKWRLLYVLLALGALSACGDGGKQDRSAGPGGGGPPGAMALPVEAVAVHTGVVNRVISTVGSLRANESVVIRSEIVGRVAAIQFTEGEAVKAGADLIRLDDSEQRAQLAESAATVKLSELNFARARDVFEKKLLSQQNYDEALQKLHEARSRMALNEARIAKTRLTAPFAGVLGLRQVSVGDYIKEGQDIVNLEDIHTLKLDFRAPETYLASIKPEQEVTLQVDAYPARGFSGTLYAIDPRIDEQTRTILLRARIPNPDMHLRPGMFARVSLVLESRTDAVLVPEQALLPVGDTQFVYRVVDGKAVQTKVLTGQRNEGHVEIVQGLKAGDTVITAGQTKVRDGALVRVITAGAAAAAHKP
ncbi:MAG: efflux RND transporter periplasmic adaptor subunit [Gammaproteobacteria bacterium]|nr:efflux RND transporter periplasmic adaptor subunit [Gammaproteobacteria bacterium]